MMSLHECLMVFFPCFLFLVHHNVFMTLPALVKACVYMRCIYIYIYVNDSVREFSTLGDSLLILALLVKQLYHHKVIH